MRQRTALIFMLSVMLASWEKSRGDEGKTPRLLLSDLGWVRFDVIMGRLVAVTNRAKGDRQRARRRLLTGLRKKFLSHLIAASHLWRTHLKVTTSS